MRLRDLRLNKSEIAGKLEVSEGTIRYHLKRSFEKKTDGRKDRRSAVSPYKPLIDNRGVLSDIMARVKRLEMIQV